MKTYRILATLALVALLAFACGPKPTPAPPTPTAGPPPTKPPAEISGTIRIYKGPFGPEEMELMERINAEFNKEYPNVKVIFEMYDWPTQEAQTTQAFASGSHDLVYLAQWLVPKFCYEGGPIEDLTPYVSDPAWKDEYDQFKFWDAVTSPDGLVCGVPFAGSPLSMYVANLDLLKKAGVPDDWYTSMDKVRDAAIAVSNLGDDTYGIAFRTAGLANFSHFDWYSYILRAGGNYLNEDYTRCGLNKPEVVDNLQWLVNLQNVDKVTPEFGAYTWDGLRGLFQGGKLGIMHDETYFYKVLKSNPPDFEYDFFPIPGNVKNLILITPGSFTMHKDSKNKEAAWEWMKFFNRGDILIPIYINGIGGGFPGRYDSLEYGLFPEDPFLAHAMETFIDYGYSGQQFHPQAVEFQNLVQPLFDEMMQGVITPQEMVDKACEQIEAKLKK